MNVRKWRNCEVRVMGFQSINKWASLLLIFLLSVPPTMAAAPAEIAYQGKLADSSGNPVTNNNVTMVFGLYDAQNLGNLIYSDTRSVPVSNGIFNAQIGSAGGTSGGSAPNLGAAIQGYTNLW